MSPPPDASQMFRACAAIAAQHPANVTARKPDTDYGDFLDMLGKHEPFHIARGNDATRALFWLSQNHDRLLNHRAAIHHAIEVAQYLANHMADYYHKTPEQLAELERNTRGDMKRQEMKDKGADA